MNEPQPHPDWCPPGFVEFLEQSLEVHEKSMEVIRTGVEQGRLPEKLLKDQEKLLEHSHALLQAVRDGDQKAFEKISEEGRELSRVVGNQIQAIRQAGGDDEPDTTTS